MQFTAKIIDVTLEQVTSKNGKPYTAATVLYQKDGKTEKKKLVEFVVKKDAGEDSWKLITTAAKGTDLRITSEKEGEYWQWKNIESSTQSATTPTVQERPSMTYKENDEKRQTFIIRQSSIASAVNLLKDSTKDMSSEMAVDHVLSIANTFESFVQNGYKPKLGTVESFSELESDDVPF